MVKIKTPNFWEGRRGYNPIAVVLHITNGSSRSAISWIKNPDSDVSYHYMVRENASVVQFVEEKDSAWANGVVKNPTWEEIQKDNPNLYTISVAAAIKGFRIFPPISQWFAVAKLVKDICKRNSIWKDRDGIVNHFEINADKTCPGLWFRRGWIIILMKFI